MKYNYYSMYGIERKLLLRKTPPSRDVTFRTRSAYLNPIRVPSSSSCVRASVFGVRHGGRGEVFSRPTGPGPSKRWSPGCVNAACKARLKWKATAGTKFTKLGACSVSPILPSIAIFAVQRSRSQRHFPPPSRRRRQQLHAV